MIVHPVLSTFTWHNAYYAMYCCREDRLNRCDSLLYAHNDTIGEQPVLSPRPIVDAVLQLQTLLNNLEQVVANVIKNTDNKKLVKKALLLLIVRF